jgi:beta-N-acetylhexosaminidase
MRRWLLFSCVALALAVPWAQLIRGEAAPPGDSASTLLSQMTPEERVGQLFLISFRGSAPAPDDPIFNLIRNEHISGVLLQTQYDNFADAPGTLDAARRLISTLQVADYQASITTPIVTSTPATTAPSPYIPLFVAVGQEGGGAPYSQILSGLDEQPSELAIGATWDVNLSRRAGEILGEQLAGLGFNLLLGPSLDVLGDPRLSGAGDLGVRAFGGDPFWVGQMGRAYIEGLHAGSGGRLAVVATQFPGLGDSDRPAEEEVATVRRSLDQLRQSELSPFFAVTAGTPGDAAAIADGMLTAHIRYQGLQGNIRVTTRPISLDRDAFQQLMSLEPLASWRAGGGVMVSDSLGSRAIRRFIDPLEQTFVGQLVARDAFLAGNDLLTLSNFRSTSDPDEITSMENTLGFFSQKYREDPVFAQRVDEAALRILRMKLRIYGGKFGSDSVLAAGGAVPGEANPSGIAFDIARAAATLISPTPIEVSDRLGVPPKLGERIVFFTDSRSEAQCSSCASRLGIDVKSMEKRVLELYGSSAAGQVRSWNLTSFTMADLAVYLGDPPPTAPPVPIKAAVDVEKAIKESNWLVFQTLKEASSAYGSDALKLLLDRRPDLLVNKRVVVFAYDVPYDLDATDLSKIDAFYGLYSKTASFVDVAARLLFQELPPIGASPVSVPGVGYDLTRALAPDPHQVIPLSIGGAEVTPGTVTSTPAGYRIRDQIQVTTGIIIDTNSHAVPDGTPVDFQLGYQGDLPSTLKSTTKGGIAQVSLALNRIGLFSISARSDPAEASDILQLNVQEDIPAFVTVIAPTPVPTETLVGRAGTPPTPVSTPVPADGGRATNAGARPGGWTLLLGLVGVAAVAGAGYVAAARQYEGKSRRLRFSLVACVGGLLGYDYLALGLAGAGPLLGSLGPGSGLLMALLGGMLGLAVGELWYLRKVGASAGKQ